MLFRVFSKTMELLSTLQMKTFEERICVFEIFYCKIEVNDTNVKVRISFLKNGGY